VNRQGPSSAIDIEGILELADLAGKPLRTFGTNPPTADQASQKQQTAATPPAVAQAPPRTRAPATIPDLSPLRLAPTPATPFPELPGLVGRTIAAIEDLTQAPRAICGNSVLAAVALAVQGHADIKLPGGHVNPVSLFLVTVAESGSRKSSADRWATMGIRDEEAKLEVNYTAEAERYTREMELWTAQKGEILKPGNQQTPERRRELLNSLGDPPKLPPLPVFLSSDPTIEGLLRSLREGQSSQGLFSDEGGSFIGGFAMRADTRLNTISRLSNLWDGIPVRVTRQGAGTYTLHNKRLSVHLMMQPLVASQFLGAKDCQDQGITSRILPAFPDSNMGRRPFREPSPASRETVGDFAAQIKRLLRARLPEERPALILSGDARQPWENFYNRVEAMLAPGGHLESIRGLGNKLGEHALRIASVLTLFNDLGAIHIELPALHDGVALATYYADEARRLMHAGVDPAILRAEALRAWIFEAKRGDPFALSLVYHDGPNALRTAAEAKPAVALLMEAGWLEALPEGVTVDGKPRRHAYKLTAPALEELMAAAGRGTEPRDVPLAPVYPSPPAAAVPAVSAVPDGRGAPTQPGTQKPQETQAPRC